MYTNLNTLMNTYEKILLIDLQEETFKEIKTNSDEQVHYQGINQWFIKFANSDSMAPNDRERFIKFANIETIKQNLMVRDEISIVYQRKINDVFHWCLMSIYKTDIPDEVLLTVKDIQDCWLSIEEQKNRGNFNSREKLQERAIFIQNKKRPLGLVIFEFKEEDICELFEVFTYHFNINSIYQYDATHIIVPIEVDNAGDFTLRVSDIYKNFMAYDVEIGHAWQDAGWNYIGLMGALSANLQNNKSN